MRDIHAMTTRSTIEDLESRKPTGTNRNQDLPSASLADLMGHVRAAAKGKQPQLGAPAAETSDQYPVGLRAKAGAKLLGIGESTFWRIAKDDPAFPRGRKLTPRTTIFLTAELLAWRDSKVAT